MKKVLLAAWGLMSLAAAVGAEAPARPLVVALGDEFYFHSDHSSREEIAALYADLEDRGFDIAWSGCPAGWDEGVGDSPEMIAYLQDFAAISRANGIGAALGMNPAVLLPYRNDVPERQAQALDPATGERIAVRQWDFANPAMMAEFAARLEALMEQLRPRELYFVDEVILIEPGDNAHERRMSAYWTSPTYSEAALASFRDFVARGDYPELAGEVRFPVTTAAVAASPEFNMGLPAVPLTPGNAGWLTADDGYPSSPLWQAWFDWREEILTRVHAVQFELAEKVFSGNPAWRGCMASSPTFWFCRESGLSAERIAAIPQLKYLVAGYMNGRNLGVLQPAAEAHGKQLGGMIELSTYGNPDGVAPEYIVENFRNQVEAGARLMLVYPLATFRRDREGSEEWRRVGMDYKPEQAAAWDRCAAYLETLRSAPSGF